jgi:hypothetical protein
MDKTLSKFKRNSAPFTHTYHISMGFFLKQLDLFDFLKTQLGTKSASPSPAADLQPARESATGVVPTISKEQQGLRSIEVALAPVFENLFAHARLEVKLRKNRSTLGSLRADTKDKSLYRFTVAQGLLESSVQDAVLLGKILLHRMAQRKVPSSWSARMGAIRHRWSLLPSGTTPPAPSPNLEPSDADLSLRMHSLAHHLPELCGRPLPRIIWRASHSKRILGRYLPDEHEIQLHLALAHPSVPKAVLNDLIHHELLHAALGVGLKNKRRRIHTPAFRLRERNFADHEAAKVWLHRHLHRIMGGAAARF